MAKINKNWIFTLNNPDPIEWPDSVKYAVWQLERGEEGTLHYQGYIQLHKRSRLSALKKILPRAHWEPRRGSHQQAVDYCTKEETREQGPYEHGIPTRGRGQRNDIIAMKDAVLKEGAKIDDVIENHTTTICRYPKFFRLLQSRRKHYKIEGKEVILLIGAPGTGKTHYASETYPDAWLMPNQNGTIWFDTYEEEKEAILDDFCGRMSGVRLDMLLRLLHDRTERVPIKGAFVFWCPDKVIITTNIHPKDWYDWEERPIQYEALCRRITKVVRFHEIGNSTEVNKTEFLH